MSVTCRHVRQLHDAYIDRELPAGLTAEVHAHLLQCPACQQEVEMVRACGGVIAADRSEPQLDAGFTAKIAAAVAARTAAMPLKLHGRTMETRRDRRMRRMISFAKTAIPAVAAMLFFAILIKPGADVVVPATAVKGVTVEQAGVKDVVGPTLSAFDETRRAVTDFNQFVEFAASDAASGASRVMGRSTGTKEQSSSDAEPSLLDFLLPTFDEMMRPSSGGPAAVDEDPELIRL